VHALLVAEPSNLGEEEAGNFRKVEGKLVGHKLRLTTHILKRMPIPLLRFRLERRLIYFFAGA